MTEELKVIRTSCRTCIFAENKISFPLAAQVGCQVGRLEKFKKQGRANLDETTKSYYIIEGVCNMARGEKWKEVHVGSNLVALVQREVYVTMDIVLYTVDDLINPMWKLEQTVNSCVKQKNVKPKKIVVVVKSDIVNYKDMYDMLTDICESYDVPFQLVRVIEEDADVGRCVEMGIDKCSSQYVSVFDLEHRIPANFVTRFNTLINDEMAQIVMIKPTFSYGGLVITRAIFELLDKNRERPIFEKVEEKAIEQDKEYTILSWDTLWNSM